jgi:outer membrane protein insertion porin family
MLKSFAFTALIALSLFARTQGFASTIQQQPIVEHIDVVGLRKIPSETVRSRIFTREGDVYDSAAIERDFAALWNTGFFDDLRFEREESPRGYILHIYVTEKPTIRSIEYKNLNTVTNSDVLERFKKAKVGLSVESQYDPAKVKHAEVVLKDLLAEHGHQFATIRTEVRKIPPAAVGITFVVKEGPKVKVGRIKFEGNKRVSSRTLRSAMKNLKPIGVPKSIFLENLFSKTYDSTKLDEDAERVRYALQDRGFFKAVVGDPKTQMRDTTGRSWWFPVKSHQGKVVDITLPIEEGEQYKLGSITFSGNKAVANEKALRSLFPIKDGSIFVRSVIGKGLENLRKAYGELGYINFTSEPKTTIDEEKKLVNLEIAVEENKSYSVRRIEFTGNTTTRDKVIRRELALEEGNTYNNRLWELSLQRLNQLQYFEPLKPDESTETHRNDQDATVDLNLKLREKGKNSIGLTGGVSGLAGGFIGINYETNNFLGLGETLRVEANVGSRERNVLFGFNEPYLFDRPLNLGFSVYTRRYDYNQLKETEIQFNQRFDLPQGVLDSFQNFSQASTGFTVSLSYPLRHSFKRVGLTYGLDTSSVSTFSTASQSLFEQLAFRNVSGPNALRGVLTSRLSPSFSFSTIDYPQQPHSGSSLFVGGDISGIGGNVAAIRPIVEWKQFMPIKGIRPTKDREAHNTIGYRVQASFITGYRGLAANPAERFYTGGENDIRGFDIRTISPYIFLADQFSVPLVNPDDPCVTNTALPCQGIPIDPSNPRRGLYSIPVPVGRIVVPGGDTSVVTNLEYVIPIIGQHLSFALFDDFGMNFVVRPSQLHLTNEQFTTLTTTSFGCEQIAINFTCSNPNVLPTPFKQNIDVAPGTNYVPRMSTGAELRILLPIINAPFRIYYAYNPLILDTTIKSPSLIQRSMFPVGGAGDFTYLRALQTFVPDYRLKEPRKTFRFTVATTF